MRREPEVGFEVTRRAGGLGQKQKAASDSFAAV